MKKIKFFLLFLTAYIVLFCGFSWLGIASNNQNLLWDTFWALNFPIMILNYTSYGVFKVPVFSAIANLIYPVNENDFDLCVHYLVEGIAGYIFIYLFIAAELWILSRNKNNR